MELFILNAVVFLRPLASLKYGQALFEVAGVLLFAALLAALLVQAAVHRSLRVSAVDGLIVAFVLWCVAIYAIYFEAARVQDLAKLVIPLLSYVAVKHVVHERAAYRRVLAWAIVGFAVPIVASAVLIATGQGLDYVSYWTEVPRWEGAYVGAHSLGHSMTLFLMLATLYFALAGGERQRLAAKAAIGALALVALYALYMSQVRTAVLGLAVFALGYTFFANRRLFFYGSAAAAAIAVLAFPYWAPALVPEYVMMQQGVELDVTDFGSDRPRFWLNDLAVFQGLPIDQKLAGVGIGAVAEHSVGPRLYGHNDWLLLLTQTGIVGLLLYAAVQVAILRRILALTGRERHAFLALFAAVQVMMLVSNSYVWRIQVAHLYYVVLAFVEIVPVRETVPATARPTPEYGSARV